MEIEKFLLGPDQLKASFRLIGEACSSEEKRRSNGTDWAGSRNFMTLRSAYRRNGPIAGAGCAFVSNQRLNVNNRDAVLWRTVKESSNRGRNSTAAEEYRAPQSCSQPPSAFGCLVCEPACVSAVP